MSYQIMDKIEKKELKAKYKELWLIVNSAIRKEDPIGLLDIGAPEDEYDLEVGTVLPRLKSAASENDVCTIIHEEFVRWFDEPTAGPKSAYKNIAREVWKNYHAKQNL